MPENDPQWYKDAIIYQVHVRAFQDSIGDGMGDFRGLMQRLDYVQDLGVTAIWLLPFYPSPLRDDGYDIADYTNVHPHYGTLQDFQDFLHAAHERGLRVITELVVNHTSDQHPWFQRARRAPAGSSERDFYVWNDTADRYQGVRIIFQDFEHSNWSWDPVAHAHYWHRFYSHQPDLNFDNPAVWDALFPVLDFWMGLGVDGMRLDAVPYLFEREGTTCENLPETHDFLRALRRHVDEKFTGRMLLAEANQWPEDAVAYFGQGDECHMAFHFPLMPRLFMAIHMEDRFPVLDIMAQTPAIPDGCQWGLFLRNHDELTLEMVTDEERDYMYRAYAHDPQARINLGIRRRLAPLLGNNRRRIELMHGLLFSLPGTPVLYYGDELGMGDNIYLGDRNGVRTPMQWSDDRNAGFSRANPQKLYLPVIIDPEYHHAAVNVEAQQKNPNSLLWWMKRLIALRKGYRAFGRGTLEFLHPSNSKILVFLRRHEEETILIVANLSRFVQHAELDLSAFQGLVPVELFSGNAFPPVGKQPYALTFGPHAFYWFALQRQQVREQVHRAGPRPESVPVLAVRGSWDELFKDLGRDRLEEVLPDYLNRHRWAGTRRQVVKAVTIQESFPFRYQDARAVVALAEAEFDEGPREAYLLTLAHAVGDTAHKLEEDAPAAIIARVRGGTEGLLFDPLAQAGFCTALLEAVAAGRRYFLAGGELSAGTFTNFHGPPDPASLTDGTLTPTVIQGEHGNASIQYGQRFMLRVFRRIEEDINPDLEVGRFLTERAKFPHVASVLGSIEYRRRRGKPMTIAILHEFVANEGTGWQYTLDELSRFFEQVLALPEEERRNVPPGVPLLGPAPVERPRQVRLFLHTYLEWVGQLGRRAAELHLALSSGTDDPAFAFEPFSTLYQRSLYQSMRNVLRHALDRLVQLLDTLPEREQEDGRRVLASQDELLRRFRALVGHKIDAVRTRYHGDFHLAHVLHTGKDFVFVDFEGEPGRSAADRRVKRSPLRDVATMLRSFHYAAYSALYGHGTARGRSPGLIRPEEVAGLEVWARSWYSWVAATFVGAYLERAEAAPFVPRAAEDLGVLLETFLLEKALRELRHELTDRPEFAGIPLRGLVYLLEPGP